MSNVITNFNLKLLIFISRILNFSADRYVRVYILINLRYDVQLSERTQLLQKSMF